MLQVDYIEAHPEEFAPFVEDDEPFDKYCAGMRPLRSRTVHPGAIPYDFRAISRTVLYGK